LSEVYDINLENLTSGSLLVNGFSHPLDSWPLIQEAIRKQKELLASGKGGGGGPGGTNQLDNSTFQTFVPPTFNNRRQENPNNPNGTPIIPVNPPGQQPVGIVVNPQVP
jgi:hypothetical protein